MKTFNDNDLELISAYLDGILAPSESARLESRLSADPEFASALADIRLTRSILRAMPKRKAPRNFTLTRKMVGLNPPLPRSYSFFKFTSAFASLLLIFTFAANALTVSVPSPAAMEAQAPAAESFAIEAAPAATEAPAMEEAFAAPTAFAKEGAGADAQTNPPEGATAKSAPQDKLDVKSEAAIPVAWQIVLTSIILSSGIMTLVLRESAKRKWR